MLTKTGSTLSRLNLGHKAVVIADAALVRTHGQDVLDSIEQSGRQPFLVAVAGGEASKNLGQAASLLSFLAQKGLGRNDAVLALGGGVIGDLAGFVAATYLRGVPWIGLPTTLLAMIDSSVGGKTGVNLPEGKNLVGAFHQPRAVLTDTETLHTLPTREHAAGLAEAIKYGLIADPELFASLRNGPPPHKAWPELVARCVAIKARIVAEDEKETSGTRALLNFGHTLGHAIENAAGYGKLLHGEAVALGMRAAAHLSAKRHGLPVSAVVEIESTLQAQKLPLHFPHLNERKVRDALKLDKKGPSRWILLPRIGTAEVVEGITDAEVDDLITLISEPL